MRESDRPGQGGQPAPKHIILCADDFALNEAVSAAIVALLDYGRLSVTSCMVQSPLWPAHGDILRQRGWSDRAGLHLNFTEPFPGALAFPLGKLMLRSRLGLLDGAAIRVSIEQQLDRYEAVMGAAPAFVDGHQHVHVFPVIREALFEALLRRYGGKLPWLRSLLPFCGPRPLAKSWALQAMGAGTMARRAATLGFRCNDGFAGLYALAPEAGFADLMPRWLAATPEGGLIMCHPAKAAEEGDVIGPARVVEYAWLNSMTLDKTIR